MWVCHCRAVTDRQITSAVEQGASNVVEIGRACGAGTRCGGCVDEVRRLCEQARSLPLCDSLLVGSAAS